MKRKPADSKSSKLKLSTVRKSLETLRQELKQHVDFIDELVQQDPVLSEKELDEMISKVDAATDSLFYLHAIAKHYYRGRPF